MSNLYVPDEVPLAPGQQAQSSQVNTRYENTVAGFDKLPNPAVGKKGFSDPCPVGEPTDVDHAVTKQYADNLLAQNVADAQAAQTAAETAQTAAETAQGNAETAETNAGNSETYAAEWANKAEDVLVSAAAGGDEVDDYSAMHWANKAATSAASIDPAMLVDQDSDTGAASLPSGTTEQRPSTPLEGMFRRNSEKGVFEGYDGDEWHSIAIDNIRVKNAIINGNFDIWQRGDSQSTSGYGSADRWKVSNVGATYTVSKQAFVLGQTDVPENPANYLRYDTTTGGGVGDYSLLLYRIENVASFAGEAVTLSLYAKADAAKNIAVNFKQDFGTGGSPSADVNVGETTLALTTSWQKFEVTVNIPSISGKVIGTDGNEHLQLNLWLEAGSDFDAETSTLGNQSGTFDIAQVQVERGSVATEFGQRSFGEELYLCQRYFIRMDYDAVTDEVAVGVANSSTTARFPITFPQKMRVAPTVSMAGTDEWNLGAVTGEVISSLNAQQESQWGFSMSYTDTGAWNAATRDAMLLRSKNGLAYYEADAEL